LIIGSALHITVASLPHHPYVERRDSQQMLNFDIVLHNDGDTAATLASIREQVFDKTGGLEIERELNANGKPSALISLGNTTLQANSGNVIFQPFDHYDAAVDIGRIRLTLSFLAAGKPLPPVARNADFIATLELTPTHFTAVDAYCLPLSGTLLVHDGHDLSSHHRRQNLWERYRKDPERAVNPNLYAYDLVRIDSTGALYKDNPDRKENWYTFNAPVHAPVTGIVVEAVDDIPDNFFVHGEAVVPESAQHLDPDGMGNHVAIRAPDGRVSWLLHLETEGLMVKQGQHVKAGDPVGRIGFSGDALFPHEHFTVTNAPGYPAQGVPSYFRHFTRRPSSEVIGFGQIDSGDIVKDDGKCGPEEQRSSRSNAATSSSN